MTPLASNPATTHARQYPSSAMPWYRTQTYALQHGQTSVDPHSNLLPRIAFHSTCILGTATTHPRVLCISMYVHTALPISRLTRSTLPCTCGQRGRPNTCLKCGQMNFICWTMWFRNSLPLSVWRILGHPKSMNIPMRALETSSALHADSTRSHTYLVKWSCTTRMIASSGWSSFLPPERLRHLILMQSACTLSMEYVLLM
mmetsp:Transcript_51422/g.104635  ORF Transcript_51422/g.104635 Transcript_51422/m.104635 type:complete len:201 (+) Transcript_51422:326-928(+)